jgi:ketosteroid isomerase-like protein
MTAEENKAILLRFLAELRKGNTAIVDDVCSEDFVFHSPAYPGWPRGLEGARQLGRAVVEHPTYTDGHAKLDDIFAVDDKVVLRWSVHGTYAGEEKPGLLRRGERFTLAAIAIYRFVDGKIVDDWGVEEFCATDTPWG